MRVTTNDNMTAGAVLARARKLRANGKWLPWRTHDLRRGEVGNGWAGEFLKVHENGVFVVLVRDVQTAWGTVTHAMIRDAANSTDIRWNEKQRIKDELFGADRLAIEVFPPTDDLTDAANSYHLWVLPAGFALPFGIGRSQQEQAA